MNIVNMEIGTETAQFPEKEYINGIFVAVYKWNQPQLAGHASVILVPGAGGTTCRNITDDHHRRQPKDDPVMWVCPTAPPLSAHNAVRKEPRAPTLFYHIFWQKTAREFTLEALRNYILRSWW